MIRHLGISVLVAFLASCMDPGAYPYGQTPRYSGPPGAAPTNPAPAEPYAARWDPRPVDPYGAPDEVMSRTAVTGSAETGMRVIYLPPKSEGAEYVVSFVQQGQIIEQLAGVLNRVFRFPRQVNLVWNECGTVNAFWDGQGQIVMCYELVAYLHKLFSKQLTDKTQLRAAIMSGVMFTFLHEFAHGLIAMFQLPAVGREEDAADQLAALVLIKSGDDGVGVAMLGAQFFRLIAESGEQTPFFDEHSLDSQRFYNVMCLVYGSNPQGLGALVGNDKLPASRARRCPNEYNKLAAAWRDLLKDHMQM